MARFWGVVHYEYGMSLRRWGVWLAAGLICLFFLFSGPATPGDFLAEEMPAAEWWRYAAQLAFELNLFMPVIAGILVSDRMWRDERLQVGELLRSTPLGRWTYILGKYSGALFSMLTPTLLMMLALSGTAVGFGAPAYLVPMSLVTFLVMNVPAFAFITIFSLACPLIMPLRIYQVLFTGYWFWGNFISPEFMPTLNGTLLTAAGKHASEGLFGFSISGDAMKYTPLDAALNLLVLAACIAAAMFTVETYLGWRARQGQTA